MALVALSGCEASRHDVVLSDRYGICAVLPEKARYMKGEPGPDFDVGKIDISGKTVEVVLGGHPSFSHRVVRQGISATDGFRYLGQERSDEKDKLLFAYERGDERGPAYVTFMASDLSRTEVELLRGIHLLECK